MHVHFLKELLPAPGTGMSTACQQSPVDKAGFLVLFSPETPPHPPATKRVKLPLYLPSTSHRMQV